MARDLGLCQDDSLDALKMLYNEFQTLLTDVDLFTIHLKTPAQTCIKRLGKRQLPFDIDSSSYIRKLERYYNNYFAMKPALLELDGEKTSYENAKVVIHYLKNFFWDLKDLPSLV